MKTSSAQRLYVAEYRKKNSEKVKLSQASLSCKYSRLKVVARRRGMKCMTLEEYKLLAKRPCHYCGWETPVFGSGIDRVDCSKGYEFTNSVPCCTECNTARNDNFTEEEMMQIGEVIRRIKFDRLTKLASVA